MYISESSPMDEVSKCLELCPFLSLEKDGYNYKKLCY